jgi:hypothetical protein
MGRSGPFTSGWFGKLGMQTLHWGPNFSSSRFSNYQGYMDLWFGGGKGGGTRLSARRRVARPRLSRPAAGPTFLVGRGQ